MITRESRADGEDGPTAGKMEIGVRGRGRMSAGGGKWRERVERKVIE